ncbi:unnamed protein product [Periconia digitata]|uniref:FHA domain-containing protein n=1 Tax=Periconia digitata TaxID=1303443 RepID=A0A9W4UWM8_9PLEO|nr:unnamed protein product [Periconia digitata]
MASDAFRVTLRSSDGHDPLKERRLDLRPNQPYTIGRASTNTQKPNLMETTGNAYIHSPVISREHAFLNLRLDPTSVHITDSSSMHGTMVNGTKLKPLRPWKLANGDVLQFGADVTRNDQYFIARKYTFEAPGLDAKLAEPQPDKSSPRIFAVPVSDSEQDDDSEDEIDDDLKSPVIPRLYSGTQANPVTIDDTEAVSQGVVISLVDDDNNNGDEKEQEAPALLGQPVPAPESGSRTTSFTLADIISGDAPPPPYEEHPSHLVEPAPFSDVDSLDGADSMDGADSLGDVDSMDGQFPGSDYSDYDGHVSDDIGPVLDSWATASESSVGDASDMDARTEFEVSDEEDLDEDAAEGLTSEDESEQDHDQPARPSDFDEDEDDNDLEDDVPLRHLFRGGSPHRPFETTGATAVPNTQVSPIIDSDLFNSQVYQPVQSMPQSPDRRLLPPSSYRTGSFAAPQYAFGCPTTSLPFGAETTRSRMMSFAPEYISPYQPRDADVYTLPRDAGLYNPTGFSTNSYLEQNPDEIINATCPPAGQFRPPMPTYASPPPPPAQAPSDSTFAPAINEIRGPTPPHDRSSPQPVRRTKVSIPEIVEDTTTPQPPTPTSVSGVSTGLKRKADEMEDESPEVADNVVADAEPGEPSEAAAPSVPVVNIQDRPKKRLRTVVGSAAKMAAYLIPSTAIAVGMLTQLPDAFFQG